MHVCNQSFMNNIQCIQSKSQRKKTTGLQLQVHNYILERSDEWFTKIWKEMVIRFL